MERRTFLKTGIAASAGVAVGVAPRLARAAETGSARWRKFEMITRIEVVDASGATRAWIPVPWAHTDYQKVESNTFEAHPGRRPDARDRRTSWGTRRATSTGRGIYGWIVENTFRDPKVRGSRIGDIKTMLETRYFGGKCADLNALYVGLARAAALPGCRRATSTGCASPTSRPSRASARAGT